MEEPAAAGPPPTSLNWETARQGDQQNEERPPVPAQGVAGPPSGPPPRSSGASRDRSLSSRYVDTFRSEGAPGVSTIPQFLPMASSNLPKGANLLMPAKTSTSMPDLTTTASDRLQFSSSEPTTDASAKLDCRPQQQSETEGVPGPQDSGLACTYSSLIESSAGPPPAVLSQNPADSLNGGVGDASFDFPLAKVPPMRRSCAGERGPSSTPGPLASEEFREIEL